MRRPPGRALRRRLDRALTRSGVSLVLMLAIAAGALAYFSSTGAGTASSGLAVLSPPTISSATPGAGTVTLSWSAVGAPGPGTVSYYVSRDGTAPEGNCPTSISTANVTSCTDTGVSIGAHQYTVTAVWRTWTATSATSSAVVTFGPATHFLLAAASTTPTAGVADNLTITAKDESNNTVTTYAGLHNLTFAGAANSPGGTHPTVSSSTGVVTNFGTATAISFVNGLATVAGTNNGVMKLYKAETALITVTDGTINNGAGLTVTVAAAAAASFSLTAISTTLTAGEADNLTVTALDAFANTATTYTGSHNLTFGGAAISAGGNHPTVSNSAGVATNFGTAEAITFASGIATTAGANNGVMKLYKAETTNITVASGAVNNGTGLTVTVNIAPPASLGLAAATVTPAAGATDNLTITAKDAYGNTITSYTGSHNLTFGGANTIGAFTPTVTNSAGAATNLGTATAIAFTNGVATVEGTDNGVMTLYKAEAAKITVTDGTLNNGLGLTVTVSPLAASSLTLAAATLTPTAGVADNLTITAKDTYGNTATTYTGSHNLTYGGASASPNGNTPTVSSSTGVVTNFGTATAISFVNGLATVAAGNNGVMKLYKAEAALITVTDGTINNGAGLTVTVAAAAAARYAWTHVTVSAGALSSPCLFTCTVTTLGNAGTFTANVSVTDNFGNTVSALGAGHTLTVSTPAAGEGSGGSFTAPTAGTSVTLTIAAAGPADSTVQFTFKAQSGVWVSDTMTAQRLAGTVYTNATATLNK